MGITRQAVYKVDNGTDYDTIYFETEASMVKTLNGNTVEEQLKSHGSQLSINIKDYGAKGDANYYNAIDSQYYKDALFTTLATDDTVAFQNAIDYIKLNGGGTLYVPNGRYILTAVDLCSNLTIKGQSWDAILKQKVGFLGRWANPNYPPSTYPKKVDALFMLNGNDILPSVNDQNIHISDLQFEGNSVESGFFETLNLIAMFAVDNVIIERCKFVAPQGDGILFITNHIESYISNITIRDCFFDGVNYQNRQGISFMAGDHILIENCYFTRLTKTTMPGAIDFESNMDTWGIVRNVTIRHNRFYKIGETYNNKPAIMIVLDNNPNVVATQENFNIYDNFFEECTMVTLRGRVNVTQAMKSNNIHIERNQGTNVYASFLVGTSKGVYIRNNTINGSKYGASLGSSREDNTDISMDIYVENNEFYNDSQSAGYGMVVRSGSYFYIRNNKFQDSGKIDGTMGYTIYLSGDVTNLHVDENQFISTGNNMKFGIYGSGSYSTDWKLNSFNGNAYTGAGALGSLPARKHIGDIYFNGGVNIKLSSTSIPNDFPIGETIIYANDSGLPTVNKAGTLRTTKTGTSGTSEYSSTIQYFLPYSGHASMIYWRYSNLSGTAWDSWYKLTGILA